MRPTKLFCVVLIAIGSLARAQGGRAETAPTWTLVEDLRIGGEDDGPKSFTDIRNVTETKNGNIFVLDFKARVIRLFDAKGNFIKQVSRDGAGPGEIRNANGMAVGRADMVWVNDPANSRFSLFRSDGSFDKQVLVPINMYGYTWDGVIDQRGRAIDRISVIVPGQQARQAKFRFVDETGKADTVDAPSCPGRIPMPDPPYMEFRGERRSMMMSIPFMPQPQVVNTSLGTSWCTPAAEYSLWYGALGQPLKEIVYYRMPAPAVPDDERQKAIDRVDSLTRAFGKRTVGDPAQIPKTKPVIARIYGDARGRVWVRQTSTPEANPEFDVFDASGSFVARVKSQGQVAPFLTWMTDTHVFTVLPNEDDVPILVRYAIQK